MIYLTGSAGFIGSAIREYLESKGIQVICHDRNTGYFDNINFCDTVINCQAYGNHYHQKDITETIMANCMDLADMLQYCDKQKVYNISSSSVLLPVQTPYSLTKQLGEQIVNSFNNPNFVNVRPYSVFGQGELTNRLIPMIIRSLYTGEPMIIDPEPRHDWIFVDSFIDLMFRGETECGSGYSYSNIEIVQCLEKISGKKLNYTVVEKLRDYDTKDWVCPKRHELIIELMEGLKITYEKFT